MKNIECMTILINVNALDATSKHMCASHADLNVV